MTGITVIPGAPPIPLWFIIAGLALATLGTALLVLKWWLALTLFSLRKREYVERRKRRDADDPEEDWAYYYRTML